MAGSVEHPVIVLTTVPDLREAASLAQTLIRERLAACVSQIPGVQSLFRWEGRVDSMNETLLLVKTLAERAPAVMTRIQELHSYDVPEIIVLPVLAHHGPYGDWIRSELKPEAGGDDAT